MPQTAIKTYRVTIEGVRPLLMNKWIPDDASTKKRGEAQDSPEMAKKRAYIVDGKLVMPAEWIERAMHSVSSSFKLPGHGKKTYKDLIGGAISIEPEFIELTPQEYKIDERTVVIPATRGRVLRYRPRLDPGWRATFHIHVFDSRIGKDVLENILAEAGRLKGVGDGRSIGMGRFIIVEFKEANEEN